jgi:hypothetical protein
VHDLAEEKEEHRWDKRFAREAGWLAGVGRARCSILAVALLGTVALPAQLYAQAPGAVQTPIELRFDIARYRVEGNTILAADEVERIVSGYAGKARDFGDVQRALERCRKPTASAATARCRCTCRSRSSRAAKCC